MKPLIYFSVVIADKAGEGARVLNALCAAGINFTALWGYPVKGRKAVLDLVAEDPAALVKALRKIGVDAGPKKTALYFNGDDRPGVIAEALSKLGAAGVSAVAVQAVCGGAGRFGALIQVASADLRKAKKALGA